MSDGGDGDLAPCHEERNVARRASLAVEPRRSQQVDRSVESDARWLPRDVKLEEVGKVETEGGRPK